MRLMCHVENVVTFEGLPFNSSIISFHIWLFKNLICTLQNNVHMLSFPILQWIHTWKEKSVEEVVMGHISPNHGTFFNKYATWVHFKNHVQDANIDQYYDHHWKIMKYNMVKEKDRIYHPDLDNYEPVFICTIS